MTDGRTLIPTAAILAIVALLATTGIIEPATADDAEPEQTEAEFVRDMSQRIDIIERRIEALEQNLSRSNDVYAQQRPMRGPRTNARELTTGPGAPGASLDDFSRIGLKLERLERKARDTEDRLGRHEAAHVSRGQASGNDKKAEKSRRKIGSRVRQIENELDELEREIRYLR